MYWRTVCASMEEAAFPGGQATNRKVTDWAEQWRLPPEEDSTNPSLMGWPMPPWPQ